jgi:putative Mn2+ efflux pump MntP
MKIRHARLIGFFFGAFQAIMPLLGWLLGHSVKDWVQAIDHWLAFIILAILGIKMIYESTKLEESEKVYNPLDISVLFMLSIATSIDAFAVGVTLSFLKTTIIMPVIAIGSITFVLSFVGMYIGKSFGHLLENKIEIAGGVILIGIGAKILVEHLFF